MTEKEKIVLGIIPARGGSKGVPLKNIRPVLGKPLIAYSIECGLKCSFIDNLIVSSDDREIIANAKKYGAEVPFIRPSELAGDKVPMIPVLQHAISTVEKLYDKTVQTIVLLDPTGPLRTVNDVENCFRKFCESDCDAVISGNEAHRNPFFNMVLVDGGFVRLVNDSSQSYGRRQDAPSVYDLNTLVWIFSRRAIMEQMARIPQKTLLYVIPRERAVDLDTEFDFQFLEFILKKNEGRL